MNPEDTTQYEIDEVTVRMNAHMDPGRRMAAFINLLRLKDVTVGHELVNNTLMPDLKTVEATFLIEPPIIVTGLEAAYKEITKVKVGIDKHLKYLKKPLCFDTAVTAHAMEV